MTIGASPSFSAVNAELGRASTFPFDMNNSSARWLAQVNQTPNSSWGMNSLINKVGDVASILVGQNPSAPTIFGYDSGIGTGTVYGSLTIFSGPYGPSLFRIFGSGNDLTIELAGTRAQSYFRYVTLNVSNVNQDPFVVFDTTAVSFYTTGSGSGGPFTYWSWLNPQAGAISWPANFGSNRILRIMG